MESFFKTLKHEEVFLKKYQTLQEAEEVFLKKYRTLQEAEADIQHFIEEIYNTKRLHSRLGYTPPAEFKMAYAQGTRG